MSLPFRTITAKRYNIVAVLLAALIILQSWLIYTQYRHVQTVAADVNAIYDTLRHVRRAAMTALNAETGYRGYLLSHDKRFLQPYQNARNHIGDYIANLKIAAAPQGLTEPVLALENSVAKAMTLQAKQIEVFKKRDNLRLTDIKASDAIMSDVRNQTTAIAMPLTQRLETRLQDYKTGQQRFCLIVTISTLAILVVLAFVTIVFNASERRNNRLQHEISDLRERQLLAFEAMNDGAFDYHYARNRFYNSPRLKQILGYDDADFGDDQDAVFTRLHDEDMPAARAKFKQFKSQEIAEYQDVFRLLHRLGQHYVWVMVRAKGQFDEQGRLLRLTGAYTDISQEKMAEDNLATLQRDLENFTYIASHDLRAPLADLHSAVKALGNQSATPLDTAGQASLRTMQAGIDRIDRLTAAILELSRIGRRAFLQEHVATKPVVERIVQSLHYLTDDQNITFGVQDLPDIIVDAVGFEQVMSGLIDNAVKYLDHNRPGHISIFAVPALHHITFTVRDNGRGISRDESKKVFSLFRRTASAQGVDGHGVGMAYVRAIVQRWNGRVWLESEWDHGTSVHFTVPTPLSMPVAA